MPKRSPRLIYAFWDDRDETMWDHARRSSRMHEHMRDLPPLWANSISYERRTLYAYGKRVRAKGVSLEVGRANNIFMRTTSGYRPGAAAGEDALMRRAMAVFITCRPTPGRRQTAIIR